jgi:hypothetical protein
MGRGAFSPARRRFPWDLAGDRISSRASGWLGGHVHLRVMAEVEEFLGSIFQDGPD